MMTLLLLILLFIAVLTWQFMARAHELASSIAVRLCYQYDVQLLDGTVRLHRVRPVRCPGGWLCLLREYYFDFSIDGANRHTAYVLLRGAQLIDSGGFVTREQ